jgi:serine/threonine-protein kinase
VSDPLRDQVQTSLGTAYTLGRELDRGGMSRVFVAREEALGRDVVVKVLAPELAAGLSAERFTREIRLAAALQEPHIVPVLTAGVTTEGLPYYTMPYVRGESLRARLTQGPVPLREAVAILRDVATALEHAHAHGLVHRDIKPENILLSGRTAVVTDFGIAKALAASKTQAPGGPAGFTLTEAGASLGTPAYMAPEQAAGDTHTDHRADLYAWGVAAYELLAGAHPFANRTSTAALIAAHFSETPAPLPASIPRGLSVLVARCLAKDREQRPASANELLAVLDTALTSGAQATQRAWLLGAAGACVVLGAAGLVAYRDRAAGGVPHPGVASVAVLPFTVGTDTASQYFADGLTEELINVLADLPSVHVAPRSAVFAYQGKDVSDISAVAKRIGASLVVEGSVRRTPGTIKVSAELVDAQSNAVIASRSVERPAHEVFTLEDSIAREIVSALGGRLGVAVGGARVRRGTTNEDAYDAFLKGEYFANRDTESDYRRAISLYHEAIRLDTTFARPWAGIANAWINLADDWVAPSDAYPEAEVAARKALALDSSLAEAHAALAGVLSVYRRDYPAGFRELRRAQSLDSNSIAANSAVAGNFATFGLRDSAIHYAHRLVALDSLSVSNLGFAASVLQVARATEEAAALKIRAAQIQGTEQAGLVDAAVIYWHAGLRTKADSLVRIACDRPGGVDCHDRVSVLLMRGDTVGARRALARYEQRQRAGHLYVNPAAVAYAQITMGDTAGALASLERAVNERNGQVAFNLALPAWDGLRQDARFRRIIHDAGLDAPQVLSQH